MGEATERCDICGEEAQHTRYFKGKTEHFCCSCHCKAGNPPATWHSGCRKFMTPEGIAQEEGLLGNINKLK